jgi:Na+-driven multidrug efflux pump
MGIAMTGVAMALITLGIRTLHLGLWAVPFGWTAAWLVRCAITALRLRSGDWERRRIKP